MSETRDKILLEQNTEGGEGLTTEGIFQSIVLKIFKLPRWNLALNTRSFISVQHVRLVPKLHANRTRVDDRTPTRDITSRRLEHGRVILDRSEELWWQLPSFTSH